MSTAQFVFNIVSVILMAFLCFIWNTKDSINVFFKMLFFCAMLFGIMVLAGGR